MSSLWYALFSIQRCSCVHVTLVYSPIWTVMLITKCWTLPFVQLYMYCKISIDSVDLHKEDSQAGKVRIMLHIEQQNVVQHNDLTQGHIWYGNTNRCVYVKTYSDTVNWHNGHWRVLWIRTWYSTLFTVLTFYEVTIQS